MSPYEPPERQGFEQRLEDDTRFEQQIHATIRQEQRLADAAEHAGFEHDQTDARIKKLEGGEQTWAGYIVKDQQAIDHWNRAHPGGGQGDTTPADDSTSNADGSADSSDQTDDTIYDDEGS